MNIIEIKGVKKDYALGTTTVHALRGIDLTIEEGDLMTIMGPSGSGKTTLLNIIGCIDKSTGGSVRVHGDEVISLDDRRITDLRLQPDRLHLPDLQPDPGALNALENVEFPLLLMKKDSRAGNPAQGGKTDRRGGHQRIYEAPARRTFRRTAPAGGHSPRARHEPGHRAGRRTDRQPRFGHRRADPRPHEGDERRERRPSSFRRMMPMCSSMRKPW